MLKRLYRQRRRIILLGAGALMAALVMEGLTPVTLMAGAGGVVLAAVLVGLVPHRRHWAESLALGAIPAALMTLPPMQMPPALLPIAVSAWAVLAHYLIHGRWSDVGRLRLRVQSRRQACVTGTPAQIWPVLIPGEGHPDDHWTGTLTDYDSDPDDAMTVYLRFRGSNGLHDEMTMTILDQDAPHHCRYHLERAEGALNDDAVMEIRLTQEEDGQCRIDSQLTQDDLAPRLALAHWLDDSFGDEWDSFAATLTARRDWSLSGLRHGGAPLTT